jgi:putative ABC transport system permease protein
MFSNYFKISLRYLWKNKSFSAINIIGLAIGLATCLLITLYVADELSYDKYNKNANRIFRVNADIHVSGLNFNDRVSPTPLGPALAKDYPKIENTVRIGYEKDILVKKGNETLMEHQACFADSTLFEVFTLPMVAGDPQTALIQPKSMVISKSMANKYFNSVDIVGKTLLINNTDNYKITGVIKDMPVQSHVHFSFIKSMSGLEESRAPNWLGNAVDTYILARPGTDEATIDQYLLQTAEKYIQPDLQNAIHSNFKELAQKGDYLKYTTIPLTRIHLYSTLTTEIEPSAIYSTYYEPLHFPVGRAF